MTSSKKPVAGPQTLSLSISAQIQSSNYLLPWPPQPPLLLFLALRSLSHLWGKLLSQRVILFCYLVTCFKEAEYFSLVFCLALSRRLKIPACNLHQLALSLPQALLFLHKMLFRNGCFTSFLLSHVFLFPFFFVPRTPNHLFTTLPLFTLLGGG